LLFYCIFRTKIIVTSYTKTLRSTDDHFPPNFEDQLGYEL